MASTKDASRIAAKLGLGVSAGIGIYLACVLVVTGNVVSGFVTSYPVLVGVLDPLALFPTTDPLSWPALSVPMLAVIALVLAPLPLSRFRTSVQTESVRNDTQVRSLRPRTERQLVLR